MNWITVPLPQGMTRADFCWLVKPRNDAQSCPHLARGLTLLDCAASIMIRNGIYLATTRFQDGVEAYNRHVMVLRDGTMRWGRCILLYRRKLHLF